MRVSLEFRLAESLPVNASSLTPDLVLGMPETELHKTCLDYGNTTRELGSLCRISYDAGVEDSLLFCGDTHFLHRAGFHMSGGRLEIDGPIGPLAGAEMSGGELLVKGDADDGLGLAMTGGRIRVEGNAGNRLGGAYLGKSHGMSGGTIIVTGNAGTEAGMRMHRGLVAVGGDAGDLAGLEMRAGTLLITGDIGRSCGLGMQRGSIVGGRCVEVLPGFTRDCCMDWHWLRLLFDHLNKNGVIVPVGWQHCVFSRYSGDATGISRGEILLYETEC
ncbi:MAG: formylmethanofuran dehydrogenase subunit C [Anaerolineales bacterium]|nr:formylmethanofuran dehydrogenase subunit C [Anaerolineales bacterium]